MNKYINEASMNIIESFKKEYPIEKRAEIEDPISVNEQGYVPYFVPEEIIDLEGYYSDIVSDAVLEHLLPHHHDDHQKSADRLMEELRDRLRNAEEPEEIHQIKQDMIALGWNPEVDYTEESAKMAKTRYLSILNDKYHWIRLEDVSSINIDSNKEPIEEASKSNLHSVHIVLSNPAIIADIINNATKGDYSHASIGFDNNFNELFSFSGQSNGLKGGFVIEDIKQFPSKSKIAVCTFFITDKVYKKCIKAIEKFKKNAKETSYGWLTLFTFLFNNIKIDIQNSLICSQFVDIIMKLADFSISGKESVKTSPNDIFRGIENSNKKVWLVYKGLVKDLNVDILKSKIKLLQLRSSADNSIILEFKMPIEVDDSGDVLLTNPFVDYEAEYYNSHKILVNADKSNNLEAMKYELARLYYMNYILEKTIYHNKNLKNKEKNIKTRAKILNDFNKYLKIVLQKDKTFVFGKYYEESPFDAHTVKVNRNTIGALGDIMKILF